MFQLTIFIFYSQEKNYEYERWLWFTLVRFLVHIGKLQRIFRTLLKKSWICLFWSKIWYSYAQFSPRIYNEDYQNANNKIADIICDDSKRVTLNGTYNTYHVDCEGYDLDGTLIFSDLDYCGSRDRGKISWRLIFYG